MKSVYKFWLTIAVLWAISTTFIMGMLVIRVVQLNYSVSAQAETMDLEDKIFKDVILEQAAEIAVLKETSKEMQEELRIDEETLQILQHFPSFKNQPKLPGNNL